MPQVRTKTLPLSKVFADPKLHKQLRKLTLDHWSGMNYELNYLERASEMRSIDAKAILALVDDKIAGWALLSNEDGANCIYESNHGAGFTSYRSFQGSLFEIYVSRSYRKQGVGTAILKKAKRLTPRKKLVVVPWDKTSRDFYAKSGGSKLYHL
jgi:GNAT superfamily N-acetyltransferase